MGASSGDRLEITVRPLGPAGAGPAQRAKGVVGGHRAPGTLPLERWLRVGRPRQQATLATLVVAGLLAVVVPLQQRAADRAEPLNAAAQGTVSVAPSTHAVAPPAPTAPGAAAPAPAAPATTTTASAAPSSAGPVTAPPAGASPPPAAKPAGKDELGPSTALRVTGSDVVALTFDDGPDPVQTPKILGMLAKHKTTATFCLVGEQVQKHPQLVRDIAAAGHALCNHTWSHNLKIGLDAPEKIAADLRRTNDAIRVAVPDAQIPFFRAPGGNFSDRLIRVAKDDGMTSLYWQVDPRDWEHLPGEDSPAHVKRMVDQIRAETTPGAIVLSHDFGQPDTITAYEQLMPWLAERFTLGLPAGR